MAYENLKQTVNDYERESINIADDTYNQLTAQMDKTLADIDAFLKTGKEDAATRAAFETAEGNLQSEKLKSSVKTDTAKIMGSAGAGVRSGMAKDTLKKANREYDITSKKAKADIGAYKANAALNISSQKLDVYQNSTNMKSDASAQAYEQTMNDRQFEYKKEQDAIDNALANQRLELDKQQFEFQKQKLENEKTAAAIGVANNLIKETTIENPETGAKETVQYYDFDQDGEMSAAERSLYVEDKGQRNYLNALKSIGMATSVDEISQSLYKMQTDLFGSGIDRVTGEIASWDNYSGFNDEYAKQLYMNFGLTDAEATEMMHEAKAMCFLNNYAKGDGSVVFGTRNADGTYANEEFYRNGLKETGISDDRVEEIINNLKTYWDSVYNEIILPAQNQLDPIYVDAQKIIEDLYSQEYWDYGVNIFQNASDRLAEAEKELNKYSPGEEEYYAAQEKYSNAVNQFNWIQNLLVQYNYNYSVLTIGTEYRNGKTDDKIASEYDVQNTQNVINEMKQEYTELMFNLTQYKDLIYTNTTGAQYAIVREYLKESNSDYDDLEKYLLDYVRKWRVNEDSRENNVIANSSADNGNEDLSKVRDAIEKICGPDNLDVSIVGFALYISALDAQRQYDSWTIEGMSDAQKVGVGIGAPIANLFTSLGALPENVVEGISNMFEDPTSMDGYVPYLAKKSNLQLADIKMQKYVESVQQEISEFSPFLGTIYGIGSSILQNVSTFAVSALANFILPGSGAVVGAAIMSASAFNQTYNSAQEMGVPAENAFFAAAAASFAEFAFEKWSLGVLFDPGKITSIGVKSTLGKLGIIGAINASEEMNTEVANILSEAIFLKDKSEYNLIKQELMTEKHISEEEAEKQAFAQTVARVAVAGAGGFISGVIMGGPSLRMSNSRLSSAGKSIRSQGKINSLIQKGLSFNNGSEANRIATELNNKIANKGKVSNAEIGNLARAIAAETQSASAGLSGVDDGVSAVSKETALSNVSSGKVSVSDINTFMPGNEDARAYFKEQTGIELSNNPKTAFAQIVEYVATKTGKTTEQVASELLSNAETSVDVTQKTIASLKSSGNEANVKVAEAFEFLNSEDGVRMLEMQKNNQQPSNGTDAELYQQMLTAKQVIENNRWALEQGGYEIGTVDFNGIDVPVVVPKGYSDNARAEAVKYVNEQAKTEPQKAAKTNSEKANKATQAQSKGSVKAGSQSKSTKTKSDSQADTGNAKIKKRTITKKNGDTTVIREKETTSKNKAFKKAKQVSRVETVGKTSARYDYTEVDTSNIYDSEMMDEINVAKEIAKAAGAKNIVFISGDSYLDGKKMPAQGFHSIGGTIFVNVDKSSLYSRTIGHEVYHQIRQTNKAGLKAYEDIVRNIIEKGESSEFDFGQRVLSSRRAKEIINAYKNNDSTMSKDALFEEVCAEFAGEIMTNPAVARALAAADTRAGNAFLRMTKKILAKIQGKENLSNYYNMLSDVEKALVDGIRTSSSKIEADDPKTRLQLDEKLGQQISDWYAGLGKKYGSYNGLYFDLGATPSILVRNGAPKSKLIMYDSCVVKVTGGKHAISTDEISKLPSALSDPIFLFEGSVPDSFVAVTELVDQNGNDVVVAVHINQLHKRLVVNRVASLYSKTNEYGKNKIVSYVQNQIQAGNLIELSAKKASTWFTNRGLQLPKLVQTIIDANDSIAQKTKSVNTYSMQNSKKDTQIKETDKKTTNQLDKIKNLSYNKDTENKGDRHGGKEETEAGRNAEVQGVSKGDRKLAYNVSGLVRRADHRRTGGVVRLSNNVAKKIQTLGRTYVPMRQADATTFYEKIGQAKQNNSHGAFVTQYKKSDYKNMLPLLGDNGNVGVAVKQDGDIVSVFKNDSSNANIVVSSILLTAIENGGVKLDNFHGSLSNMYADHGFIPVARAEFVDKFAPPDWNYDRDKRPDIIFWIHNGDSVSKVVDNIGKYPLPKTMENIPKFYGIEGYDKAAAYRDQILNDLINTGSNPAGVGRAENSIQNYLNDSRIASVEERDSVDGEKTKFQLEDSKGFEQIRHLYDTVTDEEYSMISEWLKEFGKKYGNEDLYGMVNIQREKTFASIIKVIDNAKLFNKEAMNFFKDNFDVAYINMETYDNATAYLLDYAGEKLNDVSSRIAGIDTEESSYRALVEQISRDVMETGIGASQSTRDDIFNYVVKKSKKDMTNEAKQYEKLSKFFAENKLIANQDTLSVGNTILSMNGTTIDDYYKSLQREFGKEMFPNLSGYKGKVDQIKYYVGMVDDYNISKTILGGKDIDIYNAYVRTVVNDAIDTTEKNMMYAYRIATEPKMAQKDFDAYKLYRQALAEGASGILSLNQKRDDIKSQIKRIEYGSSLSPQAREYLTLVRKNGKKQVSTSNNREAIKEIYSISKKLIDLYDQLGRADRAITRTLKGRKSAMYTFIKSLIRNPNQYRNLNRAHASLISLENIIDLTMGADAQMFKDIIVAQYSENESARLRALNMYRVPAADAINKYNIDPNSERGIKIGSVIQLLGEGIIVEKDGKYEISKTAPRDMIYYTDKKGGKGFLQSISKKQFNGLKEVESTGLKGKVEKAVSGKTKDRIRERMVDLNEYVNSISNEDMIAVREISSAMSGVYEDLYRSLTDTLIRNGYPPIKHRANYFPHYIKDGMSTAETIADFVSSFTAGDLPTGVDGNTRDRKPGKKWFGNLLERTGDSTTVNAFVGFDKYLNGASHVIYHTEDIQLRRAAADMLGNKIEMEKLETLYALDTIFDSNDDRREAEGLMEAMRTRLHSDPTYNNTIVTALTRNANAIAGKTTNLDRDFGDILGRNVLQSIEKFNRFVGRGMVGFNLRSALTNIITIPQLTGTVKMTNIAKAIRDVAQYDALRARNETMEFLESNSSFLYNRVYSQHGKKYSKGYIKDTSQNLSDKNGLWQKYNNAAFAFMNLSDSYTAKVVTAAYYNEAIDRGMTGVQAERFASEGARKLMASRVKGEMPQIFNNRVLGIFTMFQLENSNMFRFLTSDIAGYAGTGSGRVGRIIRRLAAFFISEALFEYLLEMLTGSNYRVFSFNPITLVADASVGKKNAMDIMKDLAADIPFIGGAIGEGGRYATSSVIDTWRDLLSSASKKGIIEFFTGRLSKADYVDISTKLISVLPIAGAGQAKKTIQGIADLSRGGKFGPYTTTNDDGSKSYDEKLYYAIDQEDPANFRAVLFGRSSAKEANEYWNSGLGPLSVQATEGYKEAVNAGMKNTQVYKVYRDVSVLRSEISEHNKNNPNKKRNANDEVKKLIRALDATNEQKEILWKNLTTLKNYGSVFSD